MGPTLFKRPAFWIVIAALVAAVAFAVWDKNSMPAEATTAATSTPPALELLESDVTLVRRQDLRRILPLTGTIQAVNHATVKAKVGGEVRDILVREGDSVKAGQVVARIDTSEYQARLDQARGALAAAQGQLDIAQASRDTNRALLDKGFISRNAFETTASQYAIAKANVDSARAAVQVARESFADTTLRAPIDGIVSRRTAQPGEKVSADNALLEIVDLERMELAAAVPASDIVNVAAGQEVEVRVEGLAQPLAGEIARINPATEAGSRSIIVHIRLDNPDRVLRSGMFAEARLTLARRDNVLTVPQSAVRTQGNQSFVYQVEQGTVAQQNVELGTSGMTADGPSVEIQGGLTPGATIVRANLGSLPAGASVSIAGRSGGVPQAAAQRD